MATGEKNGEKPKIQITESVKIGIHSTVFSVGESPNLKPNKDEEYGKTEKHTAFFLT